MISSQEIAAFFENTLGQYQGVAEFGTRFPISESFFGIANG
jgi:hypothetical protein